jgi:hypothetical protein
MKFTVEGADLKTGDDRTVIISATDAKDAEGQARKMGLVVARISPNDAGPLPSLALAHEGAAEGVSLKAPAVQINAPDYPELETMSRVLSFAALLCYGVTVVLLASTIAAIRETNETGSDDAKMRAIQISLLALAVIVGGIIVHGMSVFFTAFRDLVRNSFR